MSEVTSPILLDSTGQTTNTKLDAINTTLGQIKNVLITPSDAEDITYDNTQSGMTATDVQGAVDELNASLVDLKPTTGTVTARGQHNVSASEVKVVEQGSLVYVKFYATRTSAMGNSQLTIADLSGVTFPKETVRFTCSSGAYAYAAKNACYGVIGTDGSISVSCNNTSDTVVVINMVYCTK